MRLRRYVVPDNRGRITIHEDLRKAIGLEPDSILCLTAMPDNTIVITRQRICDNCRDDYDMPLSDIVMRYPEKERDKALVQLSGDWAKRKGGGLNA